MKRVVVIGAGLAGLAAARELCREGGVQAIVLEKAERAGGLAITLDHDGHRVDIGPHRIHTELAEAQAVFDEMPAEARVETVRRSRMFLDGRLFRYPPSVAEFGLRMPVRSLGFAVSLLAARLGPRRADGQTQEGCEGALKGLYGTRLYEFFFAPYMRKVWKTDPQGLDREVVRLRIDPDHETRPANAVSRPPSLPGLRYLRGGIEALARKLARDVEQEGGRIVPNTEAVALEETGDRIGAVVCRTPSGPARFEADTVLSTIPLPELIGLFAPLGAPPEIARRADALRFLRLLLVCLIVRRDRAGKDTWIYFPDPRARINRAHEPKNFDASMGPPGHSLLCAEITCLGEDDNWRAADGDLMDAVARELEGAGILKRRDVANGFVHRVAEAYPLYLAGFREHVSAALDYLMRFENLVTFGRQGLFNHNNMDHSIVMGLRAARAATSDHPAQAMRSCFDGEFRTFSIID